LLQGGTWGFRKEEEVMSRTSAVFGHGGSRGRAEKKKKTGATHLDKRTETVL